MQQMAQSLQSAQQSLQQAGQQQAAGSKGEASEQEMGQEFGSTGSSQQAGGEPKGNRGAQRGRGSGMGNPSQGSGGHAGAQQPLPGVKKDALVKATVNDKGQKLTRSYMGTPDPTQDRAAYYSIVPDRAKAAEATLNREAIPAGYKKTVRDYFDSIQPH